MRKQIGFMNNARIKNETKRQRRERVLVGVALSRLGFKYWETVWIINPHYTTKDTNLPIEGGGSQWVDYIVLGPNRKLFALEFYPKWGKYNPHKFHLRWLEQKKLYLKERGIDTLVLRRNESSQDYYARIYMFLHRAKGAR